jgi:predicted MPP superfamily phosphohydrolase
MIILGIADIHIYNYGLYSDYDENGVPSRLKDFDLLADEINHQAEKEKADAIVFAGDLVHSASPAPMVLNYTAGFVRKVAEENPNRGFIVIVGQHDLDNKNDANNSVHSVVTPLVPSFENLFYVPDRQEIDLDGVNFFCKSWTTNQSDISDFPEADVFVGHGLVHTAKDPFGHVFDNGFSVPQLLSKYPVSIIGDIHNPHTGIW